ncbi:MAG: glycosyl transferase family 2 [Rhizobiales bacterium 62-47]|nr:glycosyltransferase [Hyphomicrobiales bacterium]OJY13920.1 MAG: glycosyl transferase family 2 [Rhizobiales bacterium 62-47]
MTQAAPQPAGSGQNPPSQPAPRRTPPRQLPGFLAAIYGGRASCNPDQTAAEPGPASELDCLRTVLPPALLAAAEARSREIGIGADRVLIQWGVIDEAAYLRWLAAHTGVTLATSLEFARGDILLSDQQLPYAAEHGLLPLRRDGRLLWGIAPRGFTARRLCRFIASYPAMTPRLRLVSSAQFNDFLIAHAGPPLAHAAANGLGDRCAAMTAGPVPVTRAPWPGRLRQGAAVLGIAAALLLLPPHVMLDAGSTLLAAWFLAFAGLRIAGALAPRPDRRKPARLPDHALPVYTLIVALYREAASVAALLQAINALDYPLEKLQVMLVVEPDDLETRAAIARLGRMSHIQVLVAPNSGPRTKPKALNWALPFARGSLTAVFDAEDRPEPGQLRAAVAAFRGNGENVACVQASLRIDNFSDSWLSRIFAAEYAGQFDVFLPGLAAMRLPLPLGGTSNHFRTKVLREVGGWDAYNVTEDADLGFRLARYGYRTMTLESSTGEEAPVRFGAWLRQRSRWMKGWMQTWSVHMRAPRRLWRESGLRGVLALNILVGGNVLTALACPFLFVELIACLLSNLTAATPNGFLSGQLAPLHIATIAAGYVSTAVVGLMGLAYRGQLRSGWVLLLTPLYWLCLSVAAWRALYQLLREPYRWEKTEHGLARQPRTVPPLGIHAAIRATSRSRRRMHYR